MSNRENDALAMLKAGRSFQEAADMTKLDVWTVFALWCGWQAEEVGKLRDQMTREAA